MILRNKMRRFLSISPLTAATILAFAVILLLASMLGLYVRRNLPRRSEQATAARYEQRATFDYDVTMKPNAFFDETEPGAPKVLLTDLAESVNVFYDYDFSVDRPAEEQRYRIEILRRFGNPELWEAEEVVVGPITTTQSAFSTTIPISIPQYVSTTQTFRKKTGTSLDPASLSLVARVQPDVQTSYGTIEQPLEHQLTFSFHGSKINRTTELEKVASGEVTETELVPVLSARQTRWLRIGSIAGMTLSLPLLAGVVWLWARAARETTAAEKELHRAQRRAQGLLVETEEQPPSRNGHVVTHVRDLDDLLDLADETLRPIICSRNGEGYVYCAIDGASGVRYTYKSPAEHGETRVRTGEKQDA
jgi:hypothetical protein